jgi:glutathione synthase/RimK-type ligase-like ATP-grasp enzyme
MMTATLAAVPVALVTDALAESLDADLPPLRRALEDLGIASDTVFWDDDAVVWDRFDLVVVRSPWDYFRRRDAFIAWADRVEAVSPLANAADVLRWNTDKRYLGELAGAGLAVAPTMFVEPGHPMEEDLLPTGDIVVKPVVSAGSNDTELHRATNRDAALAHIGRLTAAGRAVMVQPYLEAVDEAGETALIYFGGRFSHAIRKGPILNTGAIEMVDGLYAAEDISPRDPTTAERALAERTMDTIPAGRDRLLYARIDLLPAPDGEPCILEVELTEPSVFLAHAERSAERFAAAIAALLTH